MPSVGNEQQKSSNLRYSCLQNCIKMNWFEGQISAGIAEAKKRNVLFVVYIHDESDTSKKMDETWKSTEVFSLCNKTRLVVMHFNSNSNECKQFSQFYPVLIVPSVSFISGQSGILLEATAGAMDPKTFVDKIQKALKDFQGESSSQTSPISQVPNTPGANSTNPSPQVSGNVGVKQTETPSPTQSKESLQERATRLRQKMEEVHQKKEQQKLEETKSKEMERRKVGQVVQKVKQQRSNEEAKSFAEELRKEKMEDKIARQNVREQIARDRAEKKVRFEGEKKAQEEVVSVRNAEAQKKRAEEEALRNASKMESARLQFRLPDGSTISGQFPSSSKLAEMEEFVRQNTRIELRYMTFCTTFPRRQFTSSDMQRTLLELNLAPSAAIVVLPSSSGSSNSGAVTSVTEGGLLGMLLAPLLLVWNLIYSLFFGSSSSSSDTDNHGSTLNNQERQSPASSSESENSFSRMGARPKSSYARRRTPNKDSDSVSRKEGNIHRFHTPDDEDDENNTYNGNSTQQM